MLQSFSYIKVYSLTGPRDIPERLRLPGFHDSLASSSGHSVPFSSHLGILRHHQLQSVQCEESNVGDSADVQKLQLPKDDLAFITSHKGDSSDVQKLNFRADDLAYLTSYKDIGKNGHIRNWPADDYNSSPNKKGNFMFTDCFVLIMYFLFLSFFKMDLLCHQAGTLQEIPLVTQAVWRTWLEFGDFVCTVIILPHL